MVFFFVAGRLESRYAEPGYQYELSTRFERLDGDQTEPALGTTLGPLSFFNSGCATHSLVYSRSEKHEHAIYVALRESDAAGGTIREGREVLVDYDVHTGEALPCIFCPCSTRKRSRGHSSGRLKEARASDSFDGVSKRLCQKATCRTTPSRS